MGLADRLGVRAVLTNAVRYVDPAQHRLADVLDAARLLRPIDRRHLDGCERWLKDPATMAAAARRIAGAAGASRGRAAVLLSETEAMGENCTVDPVRDLGLGRPHFPEPHVVGGQQRTRQPPQRLPPTRVGHPHRHRRTRRPQAAVGQRLAPAE